MNDYPYLSLQNIPVDPALARQLPRRLAYYYLALPLARDDDELTLVMAHPGNQAAVAVLQAVLGGRIVPVQGSAGEIRAALNQLWAGDTDAGMLRVLCWAAAPERVELTQSVADLVAEALGAQKTCLDSVQSTLDTVLTVAREGQYGLTVIDAPQGEPLSHFLRASATPVLLVRGAGLALHRILLVLRGHSPDESVLDWVIPLAESNSAHVTLLTVAPGPAQKYRRTTWLPYGLAPLLSPDSEPGEHLAACARRLAEASVPGNLKLRQGMAEQQIAREVAQGNYDLITIAAEAHGDFVQRVLREIEAQAPHDQRPVLVIKPIAEFATAGGK